MFSFQLHCPVCGLNLTGSVYDVVQFHPWFNCYFPLFFFMLIYDNEYDPKKKQESLMGILTGRSDPPYP